MVLSLDVHFDSSPCRGQGGASFLEAKSVQVPGKHSPWARWKCGRSEFFFFADATKCDSATLTPKP